MPTCPVCHNEIPHGADPCPSCGAGLDWPRQPSEPPPEQSAGLTGEPQESQEPTTPPPPMSPPGAPSLPKRLIARIGIYRPAVVIVSLLLISACCITLTILRLLNASEEIFSSLLFLSSVLAGMGLLIAFIAIVPSLAQPKRPRHLSIDFMRMSPAEFEQTVAEVFRRQGWSAVVAGRSGDQGVDINLRRKGEFAIAQCKRYSSSVGAPMLRDFYGAMMHSGASRGFFVTTSTFTAQARDWVGHKPISLVDGPILERWINELRAASEAIPQKPLLSKWQRMALWPGIAALVAGTLMCSSVFIISPVTATPTATANVAQRQTEELGQTKELTTLTSQPTAPMPIATSTYTPQPTNTPLSKLVTYYVTEKTVNLRSGPGKEYDIVGKVHYGNQVQVYADTLEQEWCRITYQEADAYIHKELISQDLPPTATPIPPTATSLPTDTPAPTDTPPSTDTPTPPIEPTSPPPPTAAPPPPTSVPAPDICCKHCGPNSQPCGDSCISLRYTCHQPSGCACW